MLRIDLSALVANYAFLQRSLGAVPCAAVVKAEAYGLGAVPVARALEQAGCRHFFVAHLCEALALRPALDRRSTIFILNGLPPGGEGEAAASGLVPVLNSLEQVQAWSAEARRREVSLPGVLQVDSGMSRLGLSAAEVGRLEAAPDLLAGIEVKLVMSHLACADEPGHPANASQLQAFETLRRHLPPAPASFANSAGILLGPDYHFDLGRPGIALYGVHPGIDRSAPLQPVVRLEASVIQTRLVEGGTGVGYGHVFTATRPMRLATLAIGYADGWLRSLSGRGYGFLDGTALPIVGRVSMDSLTLDVSAVPAERIGYGTPIELIGPHQTVDDVAGQAGTIGYEILTSLGQRYARDYVGEAGSAAGSSPVPEEFERTERDR